MSWELEDPFTPLQESGILGVGMWLNQPDFDPFFNNSESTLRVDEQVHLRFTDGPLALYGPNGVGKTRVLEAVLEATAPTADYKHTTCLYLVAGLLENPDLWGACPGI